MAARDRIKVVCRIRPENKIEIAGGFPKCVTFDNPNISVTCKTESKVSEMSGTHNFAFDAVFGPASRQINVFEEVAAPVVKGVLDGYNGTIFAYGQTGSGKSFSMEGVRGDEELAGIIPRMFDDLFKRISEADQDIEFNIKCSYLEIYMEKIMDLLDVKKTNLNVKTDKQKGLYIEDATEVFVSNTDEMMGVMNAGSQNRSVAATRMNATSSRSHSIFLVQVHQKNTKTDATKAGKLFCCDLAGSEKTEKTEATGQTLEEAKMINKSLSALGNVINALTEAKGKNPFIPYRDSKLTRILQESLGGNSATCLLITCSLSQYNDRETLSTLRFGNRAKSIKNAVKCNAQRSAKELIALLSAADAKIKAKTELIKLIQKRLADTFGDSQLQTVEQIQTKLNQIYQTEDHEILLSLLKGDKDDALLQAIEKEEQKQASPVKEPQGSGDANPAPLPAGESSGPNQIQTAQIAKQLLQIKALEDEKQLLEDEKKQFEDEIKQKNQEIYSKEEKMIQYEFNKSLIDEKNESLAIEKLYTLKSSNIKRQADILKLRSRLENLKSDIQIYHVSNKLKMQNIMSKAKVENADTSLASQDEDNSRAGEQSIDSETMVTDQIQSTLQMIQKIEQHLNQDIQSMALTSRKDPQSLKNSNSLIKGRRRSADNKSIMQLGQLMNPNNTSMQSQDSPDRKLSRKEQISAQYRTSIDMNMTEMEYLKLLQDNSVSGSMIGPNQTNVNDSSFFRSIVNVEMGSMPSPSHARGGSISEQKAKGDELFALRDINGQQLKQIAELKAQVQELESENDHLGQEHLAILKTQIPGSKNEQSTLDDTNAGENEELVQVAAVKDKQIDLLSNMLAQKGVEMKNQKIEAEKAFKEKEAELVKDNQAKILENQKLIQKMAEMQKIIESNGSMKELQNLAMIVEQNKLYKTQVMTMHRQINQKDTEIDKMQTKIAQYEKRMVLIQKNAQQSALVQKMTSEAGVSNDAIKSLIMPFTNNSGAMQFGSRLGGHQDTSFFNNKVFKPIRGGGASGTNQEDGGMDFKNFMAQQQTQNVAVATTQSQATKKREASRIEPRRPTVKDMKRQSILHVASAQAQSNKTRGAGEYSNVRSGTLKSQGFGSLLNSFKTQETMLKQKKIEENQMKKAKKLFAQQKYNDARNLTRQQMMANDESIMQSDGEENNQSSPDVRRGRGAPQRGRTKESGHVSNRMGADLDTYNDYDDDSLDHGETREEYDSDDDSPRNRPQGVQRNTKSSMDIHPDIINIPQQQYSRNTDKAMTGQRSHQHLHKPSFDPPYGDYNSNNQTQKKKSLMAKASKGLMKKFGF